ncbi:MBL fold metallo-hydrolase [Tundrisphaera sp. TA3]|uniref:MBL fold metallo-hydrolase n=1 Tax=Tundrisphaera sp. TA3 TaxID=3435775 RepID=UPI003EBA7204
MIQHQMQDQLQTAPGFHDREGGTAATAIADDIAYLRTAIVNVVLVGPPEAGDRGWVLVDAGMPLSETSIVEAAEDRFGAYARPSAIVLTHGHFDHIGVLRSLAERWDVPIYAHELELPYITGRSAYPPPDTTVGGGMFSALSWMFPPGPIDVGDRARALPADGSVPGLPGWRWVHTPGHTHGHVALFRDSDRALIAGDAFVTTRQESVLAVIEQRKEIHGPPMYYTSDFGLARRSVEALANLRPALAITGHGRPMAGAELDAALATLVRDFDRIAVPHGGRYARDPARADASGVTYIPPDVPHPARSLLLCLGLGLVVGVVAARSFDDRD